MNTTQNNFNRGKPATRTMSTLINKYIILKIIDPLQKLFKSHEDLFS